MTLPPLDTQVAALICKSRPTAGVPHGTVIVCVAGCPVIEIHWVNVGLHRDGFQARSLQWYKESKFPAGIANGYRPGHGGGNVALAFLGVITFAEKIQSKTRPQNKMPFL